MFLTRKHVMEGVSSSSHTRYEVERSHGATAHSMRKWEADGKLYVGVLAGQELEAL